MRMFRGVLMRIIRVCLALVDRIPVIDGAYSAHTAAFHQ